MKDVIYTSYFSKTNWRVKKKENTFYPISIARYQPQPALFPSLAAFFPPVSLLNDYKSNAIDQNTYKEIFLSHLEGLNIDDIMSFVKRISTGYNNLVFLCYEKTGDFCHRVILSEHLNKRGYNVFEYESS